MSRVGQYLLSIVAAALLISVANHLVERKGPVHALVKLITGIVLATLIVSPWTDIRINDWEQYFQSAEAGAADIVDNNQSATRHEISLRIKAMTESYILDKASSLGLNISADVVLTDDMPPSISTVCISGAASPYAKQSLKQVIREELGVSEDCILWS